MKRVCGVPKRGSEVSEGKKARRHMRKLLAPLAVLALGTGAFLATAEPAAAWTTGNVWVNFGSWNCPSGGSVVGIYWAVDNVSSGPAGGDWGDNVIYPSVRIGAGNTL